MDKSFAVFYKWKYEPLQKILVGVAASEDLAKIIIANDKAKHNGNGTYSIETTDYYR